MAEKNANQSGSQNNWSRSDIMQLIGLIIASLATLATFITMLQ